MSSTRQAASIAGEARYRSAAEWWDALGNVPLERIVFDPWPGGGDGGNCGNGG